MKKLKITTILTFTILLGLALSIESFAQDPITTIGTPVKVSCNEYDVPITVQDFTGVAAISLTLNYDPLILNYQSVSLHDDINVGGSIFTNGGTAGEFYLAYAGGEVGLTNGTTLFTLHFSLNPTVSDVTTSLTWPETPIEANEYANIFGVAFNKTPFSTYFINGTLTVPVKPVTNTSTGYKYCTIQDAIDDPATNDLATDHDIITVESNIYSENLHIDKELTITGAGKTSTFIDGGGAGIVVSIIADNVIMSGFTVQNSGLTANDAGIFISQATGCSVTLNTITSNGSGIVLGLASGNFISDNEVNTNSYYGIALAGSSSNTIDLNSIGGNGLDAIALDHAAALGGPITTGSNGNQIKTNTITGSSRDGIFFGEYCDGNFVTNGNTLNNITSIGISLWRPGSQTITDNTITNALTGIRLLGSSNNTITGNTITDNGTGIIVDASWQVGVWYPSFPNTINSNNISANSTYGMDASGNQGTTVIAENNWWGDASGPLHPINNSCGLGNAVSDYVDFMPWWMTSTGPGTWVNLPVINIDQGTYYCKIQDAIDDADDGDEINVASGSYPEYISIETPNIQVIGIGATKPIIDATGAVGGILIKESGVTIDGFNIIGNNATTWGIYIDAGGKNLTGITINNNEINGMCAPNGGPGAASYGILTDGKSGGPGTISDLDITNNNIYNIGDATELSYGFGISLHEIVGTIAGDGAYISGNTMNNMASLAGVFPGYGIQAGFDDPINNTGIQITGNTYQNSYGGIIIEASNSSITEDATLMAGLINYVLDIEGKITLSNIVLYNLTENAITDNAFYFTGNGIYSSITPSISGSNPGANITVGEGTYNENIVVDRALTLKGSNYGTAGCDAGRGTESTIAGNTGTAVTISADNVSIDGFEITGFIGIENYGFSGFNASNNNIIAESNGIGVVGVNTSTAGLAIQDNCIDMTAQLAGGTTPNAAIGLNGISGTNAAVISGNILTDGYYGYLVYNLTTVPATNITGGTITGFMQGLAAINVDPLTNTIYDPSNFIVSDITMSGFAGDYVGLPAWNFHAGVYVYTGGSDVSDAITLTVNNVNVSGTGKIQQDCAGLSFSDFSSASGTRQNITVNTCIISDNLNRGINIQGANVLANINACTLIDNGSDSFGIDGNDGFGIIAANGANVNVANCFITNPTSSTYTVSALATSSWSGGSGGNIIASENFLDQNGNGWLANNAAGTMTATCNWWGFACGNDISPLISGTVDYSQWLLNGSDIDDPGFVPGGTCAGELLTSVITGDATVCYGTSTDLEITFTGVGPFTYAINSGTPVIATTNPEIVAVSPTTTTVYTINSLSDAYCTASAVDMTGSATITVLDLPELTAVSMQASTNTVGPPFDYLVSGDLTGYDMCITPAVSNYFLDIDVLTSSVALEADYLNPFSLSVSPPQAFFDYWAAPPKNVSEAYALANPLSWQAQMWEIINGNQPFFYIKHSTTNPSGYILVDGLQYWAAATPGAEPILQVPGDYPNYTYTYTGNVTDINACVSDPVAINMSFNSCTLSGTLTYNNTANTDLNGMTVTLNSNPPVSSALSAGGSFALLDVPSGEYTISVNDNGANTGGINATDAAQINYWGVSSWEIEKVRFYAGDGNNDNLVLSADAGKILQHFVNPGNPTYAFNPDWKFWTTGETIDANPVTPPTGLQLPSITILSSSITHNVYGQCTGDFNQSFLPGTAKEASESLTLQEGKNVLAEVGSELELRIVAGMDMDLGAVSLILNFPSDKIEISEVFLSGNPTSSLLNNISGDELRIGWNSLIPMYLSKGESLITVKLKVINESGEEGIRLSLVADPLNELADGNFSVINDAVIVADVIHTSALGMIENNATDHLELANFPNPFKQTTNFEYSIPQDGQVILEIYDLVGNKVYVAVDETQNAGNHTINLDANILQPGVYTATLRFNNENSKMIKTIKILCR